MAMVLVTHDLGVVAGRTDDIAVMYAGQIVEKAPTRVAVRADAPPVHRGAAEVDPEARAAEPHPARRDRRPSARPRQAAARAASSRRAARTRSRSASTEEPPLDRPRRCPVTRSAASSRSAADAGADALARNLAAGETATGLPVRKEGEAVAHRERRWPDGRHRHRAPAPAGRDAAAGRGPRRRVPGRAQRARRCTRSRTSAST